MEVRVATRAIYTGKTSMMFREGEKIWVYSPHNEDIYVVYANKDCTGWICNIKKSNAMVTS